MSIVAFADAHGVRDDTLCYGIGVVSVEAVGLARFEALFHALRAQHGVAEEVTWEAIGARAGEINLLLALLEHIVHEGFAERSFLSFLEPVGAVPELIDRLTARLG